MNEAHDVWTQKSTSKPSLKSVTADVEPKDFAATSEYEPPKTRVQISNTGDGNTICYGTIIITTPPVSQEAVKPEEPRMADIQNEVEYANGSNWVVVTVSVVLFVLLLAGVSFLNGWTFCLFNSCNAPLTKKERPFRKAEPTAVQTLKISSGSSVELERKQQRMITPQKTKNSLESKLAVREIYSLPQINKKTSPKGRESKLKTPNRAPPKQEHNDPTVNIGLWKMNEEGHQ